MTDLHEADVVHLPFPVYRIRGTHAQIHEHVLSIQAKLAAEGRGPYFGVIADAWGSLSAPWAVTEYCFRVYTLDQPITPWSHLAHMFLACDQRDDLVGRHPPSQCSRCEHTK